MVIGSRLKRIVLIFTLLAYKKDKSLLITIWHHQRVRLTSLFWNKSEQLLHKHMHTSVSGHTLMGEKLSRSRSALKASSHVTQQQHERNIFVVGEKCLSSSKQYRHTAAAAVAVCFETNMSVWKRKRKTTTWFEINICGLHIGKRFNDGNKCNNDS